MKSEMGLTWSALQDLVYPQTVEFNGVVMRISKWIVPWVTGFVLIGGAMDTMAQPAPQYEIAVDGLACPFCAYGIEKHLRRIDGVEKVETDVAAGKVELWVVDGVELSRSRMERAVSDAGFELKEFNRLDDGG